MSTPVVLPALDGRQPLGFLAALGVARLLGDAQLPVRLAWDDMRAVPRLSGPGSLDEVVEILRAVFEGSPHSFSPGLPAPWLPKWSGSGTDPGRATRHEYSERLHIAPTWASALWTDLALDKERCECTPFFAGMGKQSLRSMFEKAHEIVAKAPQDRLREALVGWRRTDKFTGENLDIRALNEAAESQSGESKPRGVAGATWFALAALPLFRMSGTGGKGTTVGWTAPKHGGRRFRYPLWSSLLDSAAIEILLDHPAVARAPAGGAAWGASTGLRPLGVFAIVSCARRRTAAGNSAGILVAETVS